MHRKQYQVIVADPPWPFDDKLTMSKVKRGAEANYATMTINDIAMLPVDQWAAKDALLALWVPSSLLFEGLSVVDDWGFEHKQIFTWVKLTKNAAALSLDAAEQAKLAFGMGRYFRGCSEHALIGTRGKVSKLVQSKSERGVILSPALAHSAKPEELQRKLERMLPGPYLELFARRDRKGWKCVGNECPSTEGQDIRNWKPSKVKAE